MDYSLISKIPLFRGISQEKLRELFSSFSIRETTFDKGEILAMQDEPCNRLVILVTGKVKTEMLDHTGRSIKVEELAAPTPLALLFLFGEGGRFPVQVTALEDTHALVVPKNMVFEMLSTDRDILFNYLNLVSVFAGRISRKLNFISFRTIREKLAIYIMDLAKSTGSDKVLLDRSKSSLAEYFGVTRPSLERELTKMQNEGLITACRRQITILEREKLLSLVRPH